MVDTMESAEYCGLSTLVEMMFEINCATSTGQGGLGTDNMTCIIIEFRDKGDDQVSPPVKNKNRKKKPKPVKKPEEESKKT